LGTLSIISWLFAQLPQLYKNYHIKSTSGLSIFFLVEWCAGDISNLSGALLTQQATWQIVIAAYYTFVDCMLVLQYVWYDLLEHGRPIRMLWRMKKRTNNHLGGGDNSSTTTLVYSARGSTSALSEPELRRLEAEMLEQTGQPPLQQPPQKSKSISPSKPKEIPRHRPREGIFAIPNYGSFQSVVTRVDDDTASLVDSAVETPRGRKVSRKISRLQRKDQLPSPSPRTVLFLATIVLVVASHASPLPSTINTNIPTLSATSATTSDFLSTTLGPLLSWISTFLYLISRLPQLLKNHRRGSTHGLSISLFIAAFFGNLFYSTSMLLNPLAWSDYPAHGANGWAGAEGSKRLEWLTNAAPFFLGAAGVLVLDAAVAGQFWWFGRQTALLEGRAVEASSSSTADVDIDPPHVKASIVSVRVDSERTLISSRDGTLVRKKLNNMRGSSARPSTAGMNINVLSEEAGEGAEPVLVVGTKVPIAGEGYRWSWKEVDGWMRGWKPSFKEMGMMVRADGRSAGRPKSRLSREVGALDRRDVLDDEDVLDEGENGPLLDQR
jgi:uncharacterized protein with PQ loop repeat